MNSNKQQHWCCQHHLLLPCPIYHGSHLGLEEDVSCTGSSEIRRRQEQQHHFHHQQLTHFRFNSFVLRKVSSVLHTSALGRLLLKSAQGQELTFSCHQMVPAVGTWHHNDLVAWQHTANGLLVRLERYLPGVFRLLHRLRSLLRWVVCRLERHLPGVFRLLHRLRSLLRWVVCRLERPLQGISVHEIAYEGLKCHILKVFMQTPVSLLVNWSVIFWRFASPVLLWWTKVSYSRGFPSPV